MSQSTLGNSYERQSALKASMNLTCSMIDAGLIKPTAMEDAYLVEETYRQRILLWLTEEAHTTTVMQKGFTSSKPPAEDSGGRELTEKQRKAMFVITHVKTDGGWKNNNNFKHLTKDIEDYSFQEASEFIDKYGKVK